MHENGRYTCGSRTDPTTRRPRDPHLPGGRSRRQPMTDARVAAVKVIGPELSPLGYRPQALETTLRNIDGPTYAIDELRSAHQLNPHQTLTYTVDHLIGSDQTCQIEFLGLPHMRCQATTKSGRQCKNGTKSGSDYCGIHSGGAKPRNHSRTKRQPRKKIFVALTATAQVCAPCRLSMPEVFGSLKRDRSLPVAVQPGCRREESI